MKPSCQLAPKLQPGLLSLLLLLGITSGALTARAATNPRVVITAAPGFSITWDGNNGEFNSPNPGAGPTNNIALAANGSSPFGSSEVGLGIYLIANINDGRYGNNHSWIPDFADAAPFIGLRFAGDVSITNIAWGRDNGDTTEGICGGTCADRSVGRYTLQFTTVTIPIGTTPETGNPATGWTALGTIEYLAGTDNAQFSAYLRHRFAISQAGHPITATGLRIKTAAGIAIDEIEVGGTLARPAQRIVVTPAPGFSINWDGNNGEFNSPGSAASPPNNVALAAHVTSPFGSSEAGFGVYFIANINDGFYGNNHSWIPDFSDAAPFIGLRFANIVNITNISWGRDNGDTTEASCGGTCMDRSVGSYTLQFSTAAAPGPGTPETGIPATGWATLGTVEYRRGVDGPEFGAFLRHRFTVAQEGSAVRASGLRIKTSAGIAIDEIEVNVLPALHIIAIAREGDNVRVTWRTTGGKTNQLQAADGTARGGWTTNFANLGPPITIPGSGTMTNSRVDAGAVTNSSARYYRVRQVP